MPRGEISTEDYDRFCRYLEIASGITLGANKAYLVSSRLNRIMDEAGLSSLGALVEALNKGGSPGLKVRVVDAMTTNETLWFRDEYPFELLKEMILPQLGGQRPQPIRIWSAACSSGQEPYSISMAVSEYQQTRPGALQVPVQIVATDISASMLKQARGGVYDELELNRGLSAERRVRFFTREGNKLKVRAEVANRVEFRELNLLQSYGGLGQFDIVFCRNVLIYFSNDNKRDILSRIARVLRPNGHLFLGGSEPIVNYSQQFEMVRGSRGVTYRLAG
jgi:chemotaxis protein methyltransferase CheR